MLVLASSSPRRIELLEMAGYEFTTTPTYVSEDYLHDTPPMQIVEQLATKKARAAAKEHPKDAADAKAMLTILSGSVHQVYTGYCIISGSKLICGHECTSVEFYPLKESEINAYIATEEPMDKAGAYAIQGRGALLIKRIDGDFYNVVGLPIGKINKILKTI